MGCRTNDILVVLWLDMVYTNIKMYTPTHYSFVQPDFHTIVYKLIRPQTRLSTFTFSTIFKVKLVCCIFVFNSSSSIFHKQSFPSTKMLMMLALFLVSRFVVVLYSSTLHRFFQISKKSSSFLCNVIDGLCFEKQKILWLSIQLTFRRIHVFWTLGRENTRI